jgi:hypothetical protein
MKKSIKKSMKRNTNRKQKISKRTLKSKKTQRGGLCTVAGKNTITGKNCTPEEYNGFNITPYVFPPNKRKQPILSKSIDPRFAKGMGLDENTPWLSGKKKIN